MHSVYENQRIHAMAAPKPHELKKLPITKLDAARRQLETAITLWFHEADPVSIHTLTMAAHGILRAINRKRGGRPMMGEPNPRIRPGFEKEWANVVSEASNFFKHGSRDPLGTLHFAPESNMPLLFDACAVFMETSQESRPLMELLKFYTIVHHPQLFTPAFQKSSIEMLRRKPWFHQTKSQSRAAFFSEWLSIIITASTLPPSAGSTDAWNFC